MLANLDWINVKDWTTSTLIILVIAWLILRGGSWFGKEFLLPLRNGGLEFLEDLKKEVKKLGRSTRILVKHAKAEEKKQEEIHQDVIDGACKLES